MTTEQEKLDKRAAENAHLIAEFKWIVGTDNIPNVARRLGYKNPKSLARFLFRQGEHELARLVERVDLPTPRERAA